MAKIALMGFSRLKLFPVIKNDANNYEVGEGFDLPWAQSMTREADVSSSKIYGDDQLYLDLKAWNGLNSTIQLIEMPLEMMAKLGFGEYDEASRTLKGNPQGMNLEFAVTFRMLRADNKYRMVKMFSFVASEIKESNTQSKGAGGEVNSYQLIGTFTARACDSLPYEFRDSDTAEDLEWLNSVESVPAVQP